MAKIKKVYVADSFNSNHIAEILQDFYGDEAVVFCDPKHLPKGPEGLGSLIIPYIAKQTEGMAKQFENETTPEGVDLFFLSAKLILDQVIDPEEFRQQYGNPGAKVIAMSTTGPYLDDIKKFYPKVDFTHFKSRLINTITAEDLPQSEKEILLSFLKP